MIACLCLLHIRLQVVNDKQTGRRLEIRCVSSNMTTFSMGSVPGLTQLIKKCEVLGELCTYLFVSTKCFQCKRLIKLVMIATCSINSLISYSFINPRNHKHC